MLLAASAAIAADDAGQAPKVIAAGSSIQAEIDRLQKADGADSDAALALKLNRQALGFLQQADNHRQRTADFRHIIDTAATERKRLQKQLDAQPNPGKTLPQATRQWQHASFDTLDGELTQHQAAAAEAQTQVTELENQLEAIQDRPDQRGNELATTKARQAVLRAQLEGLPEAATGDAVNRARRAALQAESDALKARLEMLRLEGVSQPDRKKLLKLRYQLRRSQLALEQSLVEVLEEKLNALRRADAEQAALRTSQTSSDLADEHPLLRIAARENAAFGRQLKDLTGEIDRINAISAREHRRLIIIETTLRRVTQHLRLAERDGSTGRYLFAQNQRLSNFLNPDAYAQRQRQQRSQLSNAHLAQLEIEDVSTNLQTLDRSVAETINAYRQQQAWMALDAGERERITAALHTLYQERAQLTTTLSKHYSDQIKVLNDLVLLEQQVWDKGDTLQDLIERNLWFLPSNSAVGLPWFSSMLPAIGWLTEPQNWAQAISQLASSWMGEAWLAALMLLVVAALLLSRSWQKQRLSLIASKVGQHQHDSFILTLRALLLTIALSAARPILALSAGLALSHGEYDSADNFSLILGQALTLLSVYWFALLFLGNTLRPDGLAQVHFGWRHRVLDVLRNNLRWYIPIGLLLFLVTAISRLHWIGSGAAFDDDHLGRSSFVLMNLVLALFFWRVLDPRRYIAEQDRAGNVMWWFTWVLLTLMLLVQTALISGALAGYYYTALYLFKIFYDSLLVVIGIYLLYALALRWFLIASRRLDYQRQLSKAKKAAKHAASKQAADQAGEALANIESEKQVDLAEVSSRVHGFLRVLLVLGVVLGLGLVWQAIGPLLDTLDNFNLWQHQSGEGASVTLVAVSLADVLIAIGIVVLTVTAARNLPGLVEVVYLERIGMKSGNRYAFSQILRYTIYAAGIAWTIHYAGIRWSDVQWLVAAMGVGLGFGLKEIFANFISGLILLFERPVRVGDTITVGNITGVVARIRIRASTITDWDNKELVIPNQKLITEPLVNWTLSNPITRLTFDLGIAYGADPEKVQAIVLRCIEDNDLALKEPKPSVFFTHFGDNSLNFQIRVFVSDRLHRMPLTHDLHVALNQALAENDIEIPFPQQDIHLRSVEADLAPFASHNGQPPQNGGPDPASAPEPNPARP